jgi:hypothetical protein
MSPHCHAADRSLRDSEVMENLLGIMDFAVKWDCDVASERKLQTALNPDSKDLSREDRPGDHGGHPGFKGRLHALLRRHQ